MKASDGSDESQRTRPKILVVDDDLAFGTLTQRRLTRAGYDADLQATPFGTVKTIRRGYGLIVLDVNMPGLSGPGIVDIVRRTAHLHATKILLMSSVETTDLATIAKECGADAFISKSANQNELLTAVRKLLLDVR